jgi:hypothetical protein
MRFLAFILLLVSTHVSAQSLEATEALSRVISPGVYSGTTPDGNDCELKLLRTSNGMSAIVSTQGLDMVRVINFGSGYRWNPANRSFLSSEVIRTGSNSQVESVFRTIAVEADTQYVVVAYVFTDNRDTREEKFECVIDLY